MEEYANYKKKKQPIEIVDMLQVAQAKDKNHGLNTQFTVGNAFYLPYKQAKRCYCSIKTPCMSNAAPSTGS